MKHNAWAHRQSTKVKMNDENPVMEPGYEMRRGHGGIWLWRKMDKHDWEVTTKEFDGLAEKILKFTKDKNTIVCAGGCMGTFPRKWADIFENVITFEPDPNNFHCLEHNCPSEKIIKYQAALGDYDGTVEFNPNKDNHAGMGGIYKEQHGLQVPIMRIDSLNLERCDVIQLDIEMYEYHALLGAKETIQKFWPVVSFEINNDTENNSNCQKFLAELGYVKTETNYSDEIYYHK